MSTKTKAKTSASRTTRRVTLSSSDMTVKVKSDLSVVVTFKKADVYRIVLGNVEFFKRWGGREGTESARFNYQKNGSEYTITFKDDVIQALNFLIEMNVFSQKNLTYVKQQMKRYQQAKTQQVSLQRHHGFLAGVWPFTSFTRYSQTEDQQPLLHNTPGNSVR